MAVVEKLVINVISQEIQGVELESVRLYRNSARIHRSSSAAFTQRAVFRDLKSAIYT